MKSILFYTTIVCYFISVDLFGQAYQPIKFPETVDKKYIFDPLKEAEKCRQKASKDLGNRYAKRYANTMAFAKRDRFADGRVYLSWSAMENYLNTLVDSLLPSTSKTRKSVKAYIARDPAINAFCMYDGTMLVNVGLFAEVQDEAALAAIMGHEISHFAKDHLKKRYKRSIQAKKKKRGYRQSKNVELNVDLAHDSQADEMEADNEGFKVANDAKYNLKSAISNFELFIREEEYEKKRKGATLVASDTTRTVKVKDEKVKMTALEKLLQSHPGNKERIDNLTKFIQLNPQKSPKTFKNGENLFSTLQKQSRKETVYLLFESNLFHECVERAFTYHLNDPEDADYIYYIVEGIRRITVLDWKKKEAGFLTDNNYSGRFAEGKGILHDLTYLVVDNNQYKNIKAKQYTDTTHVLFDTYKEAFYYFSKLAVKKDLPEAYLSMALFEPATSRQKPFIDKYLSFSNARYKEFARAFYDKKLTDIFLVNTKELVVIDNIDYNSLSFRGRLIEYKKAEKKNIPVAHSIGEKMQANKNVEYLSLAEAATQNMNTQQRYLNIISTTLLAEKDENEGLEIQHYYKELENEDYQASVNIFILNPECWMLFKEKQLGRISYCKYSNMIIEPLVYYKNPYKIIFSISVFAPVMIPLFITTMPANHHSLIYASFDVRKPELYVDNVTHKYKINGGRGYRRYKKLSTGYNKEIIEHRKFTAQNKKESAGK